MAIQPNRKNGTEVATIANGASLSGAVQIDPDTVPVAIQMPAAWTAAALTFQGSADGVTYGDLYDGGTELNIATAANRLVHLDWTKFVGLRYLKIRSGTSGTPVNQGADRALKIILS